MRKTLAAVLVLLAALGIGTGHVASSNETRVESTVGAVAGGPSAGTPADSQAIASWAVEVADQTVFVGSGNRVAIYSIGAYGPPRIAAVTAPLPATVQDIAWRQDHAFVAYGPRSYESGGTGVFVYNVADARYPSLVAQLPRTQPILDLEVLDQYLLIAGAREPAAGDEDPRGVVEALDIIDAARPAVVSTVPYSHPIVELELAGQIAVLIEDRSGMYSNALRTLDLSDPLHPRRAAALNLADTPYQAVIDGSTVYVSGGHASLQSVTLGRGGREPDLDGRMSREWKYAGVSGLALGPRPLLAVSSFVEPGLRIIDLSARPQPRQLGFVQLDAGANAVVWRGDRIYVAGGRAGGLHVVAVGDPANPTLLHRVPPPIDVLPPPTQPIPPSTRTPEAVPTATGMPTRPYQVYLPDVRAYPPPIAQAVNLVAVGHLGGATWDVAVGVEGDVLYRAEGPSLVALDVTDPGAVYELGRSRPVAGVILGVAIDGGTAYLAASEAGLYVADVRDPSNPHVVGRLRLPGVSRKVVVESGVAYVAADAAGLLLIDVAIPTHPAEMARVELPGRAWAVAVSGQTAFVALVDSSPPIQAIEVGDAANPVPITSFGTSAIGAIDVGLNDVNGSLVALEREQYSTFATVFDVTDPASPSAGKFIDRAASMAMVGSKAVLVQTDDTTYHGSWLTTYDLADPSAPEGGTPTEVRGICSAVAATGSLAFAACGLCPGTSTGNEPVDVGWLHSYEDVDQSTPRLVGTYAGALGIKDQSWFGDSYAIAPDCIWVVYDDQTVALDVSEPALPRPRAHFHHLRGFTDIEIVGTLAYAIGHGRLLVLDVADPFSPTILGQCSYEGRFAKVALGPGRVYVIAMVNDAEDDTISEVLHSINTSAPANPHLIGSLDLGGRAYGVAAGDRYAYTISTDRGTLMVVDAPALSEPRVVLEIDLSVAPYKSDLAVRRDRLYVVSGTGLTTYSLADPAHPHAIAYTGPAPYGGDTWLDQLSLTVHHDILIVGGIDTAVYDTTSSSGLEPVAQYGFPHQYPYQIGYKGRLAVAGEHIYLTYWDAAHFHPQGLMVLSIDR